eukprot:4410050-Prymnesium_polylepis.1
MPFLGLRVELFVELELVEAPELESGHAQFSVRSTRSSYPPMSWHRMKCGETLSGPFGSLPSEASCTAAVPAAAYLHVRLSIGHR